jgi:hypothetical protein
VVGGKSLRDKDSTKKNPIYRDRPLAAHSLSSASEPARRRSAQGIIDATVTMGRVDSVDCEVIR